MHLVTACIKNAPKDENDQDWNGHDVWILGSECCNDLCWPLCNVEITAPRCSIIIHSMFGSLWCFSRSIYGSGSSSKVNFAELDEKKCRKLACLVVCKSHRFRSVSPGTNDFRDPGYPSQPLTFINQRTLPVSTRTLNIVNSSPVLWQVADAEKYGIYLGILSDLPTNIETIARFCLFLLGMSGLAHVGPKILIRNHEFSWSHWVHLEDFPPFSTHSAMDRYLTHREFSRTMSTFWRFLNFGTSVW